MEKIVLINNDTNEIDYIFNINREDLKDAIAYKNEMQEKGSQECDIDLICEWLDSFHVEYEIEDIKSYAYQYY